MELKSKYPSKPSEISDNSFRYDSFSNGKTVFNKKKNHLPAMGWNSWNAFGSGNTEALTKTMADCIVNLGLNKLGYKFVILDDGCYKSERIQEKLSNETVKFPGGFKSLSDYIHSKGLKFGMYNDIGTNLCAGAEVGTCGHEKIDAQSYINWGVDFLKIDNCYYLWDNATFSNPENARYVFAPAIKNIRLTGKNFNQLFSAIQEGKLSGCGGIISEDYVKNIGTFDGTNTGTTPVGPMSSELIFQVSVPQSDNYKITITYATGKENGIGQWLQLATENNSEIKYYYDDFLPPTETTATFTESKEIEIFLKQGKNTIRIMNHRRQENTLLSYATMLEGLNSANPDHDIYISLCEWGKTQPQNWGYKTGDSWRILNDITFQVGSDGNPGFGEWNNPGTQSIASQYNKAVVMDEFAGLTKGWNDPDMLMIGMNGLTLTMNKTHFAMWCMMNSPLMLGMDLRRLTKGDDYYNIISNKDLIDLNQDSLGIQAKRIWTSFKCNEADKEYITDNNRWDILAKPLSDGSIAIAAFNLSDSSSTQEFTLDISFIKEKLGNKVPAKFAGSSNFTAKDLWTKSENKVTTSIKLDSIEPCGNIVIKLSPEN